MKVISTMVAVLAVCAGCVSTRTPLERFTYTQPQMGLPFQIILYAPDRAAADAAADAAYARIGELNSILSDYDTDSELVRLSQTAGQGRAVRVGVDLWRVLAHAQEMSRETGGAFDVTCGPVVSLWRKARREKKLPDVEKLSEARRAVGFEKLRLNARTQTAELLVPYMRLDLGAIAKGYATDEALKVLRGRGITRALVSGGGDMAAGDPPPGAKGWRVELAPLEGTNSGAQEFVLLRNEGFATSGDMFQFVEIGGMRYSHIVDPRTGLGLTDHSLVVVVARDGMSADALSTAVSVVGPWRGGPLADGHGACVRVVRKPGARVETWKTGCFDRRVVRER